MTCWKLVIMPSNEVASRPSVVLGLEHSIRLKFDVCVCTFGSVSAQTIFFPPSSTPGISRAPATVASFRALEYPNLTAGHTGPRKL